jgi:two-component system, chemotaxis family, chemotaxis protein CheY
MIKNIVQQAWPDVTIFVAGDGQTAIDQYRQNQPDLILLDIIMPGKTGIDVLREIGQQARILVISAAGQEESIAQAKNLGARDFIVKPFDPKKVVDTIKVVVGS